MAGTRTYREIWRRYEELKKNYNFLREAAYDDGSTVAQYAGSAKLSEMVNEIDNLLDDCSLLKNEPDRRTAQSAVIAMLYPVELALSDACLFECDNAACFEDYAS